MKKDKKENVILFDQLGRLAPQDVEAEIMILGAILINSDAIYDVLDELRPEYFYKEAHQYIYTSFLQLIEQSSPIDLLTVTNNLRDNKSLELVGGVVYVAELTNRIASSANIEAHARIIKEKFIKRELIKRSSEIIKASYDNDDLCDCMDLADEMLDSITNTITSNKDVQHIAVNSDTVIIDIEKRKDDFEHDRITAIPTGIKELDYELYGGWQNSDYVIIGGRPGMGKTAFMMKFALAAAEFGKHVVIFELEMTKKKLIERLLAAVTMVQPRNIKTGDLQQYEVDELKRGMEYLNKLPIYIDNQKSISANQIKAKIKRLKSKGLCDIVFIDYLQLVDIDNGANKNYNREQNVAAASRTIKLCTTDFDIPIIVGCQLNRAAESTANKKPSLKDLRESGAIEQDADIVLFPHRPAHYKESGYEEVLSNGMVKEFGNLIFGKYREGGTGEINFTCNKSLTKITSYCENDDIPDEFLRTIEYRINRLKNIKENKEPVNAVKSLPLNVEFDSMQY